ncbi:hypothetical protein IBL28_14940 [Sinomicrobium sp. FJxs]|uniref:Uncharacterized protein n=2 Tax=Sinomicrobium weinanense TaxID=2842200 RepID=A0A926JTU9_9FLAO|nr:hypothetical protein [Sinomicrobium weinanense]MBU3122329.1 hypothetical protein [Sinomicrobium weinanense]
MKKNKRQKTKKSLKKRKFAELLTILLIAVSPFIFYLYKGFPETKTWETYFFTLKSLNYSSVYAAGWNFVNKFVPLYLLLLWFLTCRHWWKYIILIPMTLFIFQLFSVLNSSIRYVDEMEIYWLIPVILVTTAVVQTFRLKLFYRIVRGIDLKKLDEELKNHETSKNGPIK